ncbi:MAG: CDP-alcohol phosphatidyltransferase family protein [Rhizobiaceae bacterium]
MFDTSIRKIINPILGAIARKLSQLGINADLVTWTGFIIGGLAFAAIATGHPLWGLVLLLASRLCDGLDGAIASITGKTDLGGFLDIVLDFAFYGMIPLAFIANDPGNNAIAGGALLLAFYVNGASFLAYGLIAEKRGMVENARGSKSILYTAGLAEASETIAVFVLMCLWPQWFPFLAIIFAAVIILTTVIRFTLAYREFGEK